jgi:molybdopterin molybdotransferase
VISPQEAWARIEARLEPLPVAREPRRAASGRVLAQPLEATVDQPGHDVAAMDGFAVSGELGVDERRRVAGAVAAGDAPGRELPPGVALRIATGAPIPRGADRVVPVEQTDDGEAAVTFHSGVGAGANIRRRGEIVRLGAELLPAGTLLTPGALAVLATHGHEEVPVHRAPRVALLTTGDEVVPPEDHPRPGQLRDSHTDFLLAATRTLGLDAEPLGIAGDAYAPLRAKAERALAADVAVVCGGVSKGRPDLVPKVLRDAGAESLFHGVAIQPGQPMLVATHEGRWAFGLPGNPASVMVGFWLFVRPVLRRLLGSPDAFWHGALAGELAGPAPGARDRDRFLPAAVTFRGGTLVARPLPPRGSHDLDAYARGTALLRVRAGAPPAPAGAACEVLPLADWRGD